MTVMAVNNMISEREISIGVEDLHLWFCDIRELSSVIEDSYGLLSVKEHNRAAELRFRADRNRFLSGRIIVKKLLGSYMDTDPGRIFLRRTPFGKPYIAGRHGIHFNISHSGNRLVIGFSVKDPIGVDVEQLNNSINIENLSHSYFAADEYRSILKHDKRDRAKEFFRIWSRKESLIKGIGKGLGIPLKSFSVMGSDGKVTWNMPPEQESGEWYVHDVNTEDDYFISFATPKNESRIEYFRYGS